MQHVCGVPCAIALTRLKQNREAKVKAKQERAEMRERKEKLKSRSDHLKDAQKAINAYVRERDARFPCISCGREHQGQYHAGHFRSVGACPELRFEELNIHKQCAPCNNHLSGNLIEYRKGLIERIGLEKVEWLEGPHDPKHYSIDDLKAITAHYRKKLRELTKVREVVK